MLYDALKAAWASTALPPGVTGTLLTSTMTTTAKLANINAWTVNGPTQPMIVPTYVIYNIIVASEFSALGSTQQQWVRDILNMGTVDGSPGTAARARLTSLFTSTTQTFAALQALAKSYDTPQTPWWQASTVSGGGGLAAPVTQNDLSAAGVS